METGRPLEKFDFVKDVVIQWANDQDSGDWKEVKVGSIEGSILTADPSARGPSGRDPTIRWATPNPKVWLHFEAGHEVSFL